MKKVFLIALVMMTMNAFAEEVATTCPAMNQSREKIVKVAKTSVKSSTGATRQ